MKKNIVSNTMPKMTNALLIGPKFQLKEWKLRKKDLSNVQSVMVVFVDGGVKYKRYFKSYPYQISIGDQDSTKLKLDILLPQEKDQSDLFWALRLLPKTINFIELVGFVDSLNNEKRLDHFLINYGEVYQYLLENKNILGCRLSASVLVYNKGIHQLYYRGVFSLIGFQSTRFQILENVKYKISNKITVKAFSSLTLSNIAFGRFQVSANKPFFVFF